ncbi:hypothetical protein RBG61_03470 [Paludicola sp. MB14-C6]|uniref:hypothetical protein n=1 Tax=Paludihabitans sp. MB14-C6 TaxID=3070656 RepID=UPI0027DB66F9|nr:hypothetical protein [Paludicola sp. MB14-C6]WMJ23734.1 hypothetical protein RBG61_03470 [Paludicola sp. MB14-C6]
MKKKAMRSSLIAMLITVILEILPYGAVLNFAAAPNKTIRKTFSYFSLTPFFYASFTPLLTAILTVITIIMSVIILMKKTILPKLVNATFVCIIIAFLLSITPLIVVGLRCFSIVGMLISISLLVAATFLVVYKKVNCIYIGKIME